MVSKGQEMARAAKPSYYETAVDALSLDPCRAAFGERLDLIKRRHSSVTGKGCE